jgi:hypothetical protein
MSDIAYDGQFGIPISFTFTPSSGSPFGTAQAQVQELTPADQKINTPSFTPISGANAGFEQWTLGIIPKSTVMILATYKASEHAAAQTAFSAKITGTLALTYPDGTATYAKAALTQIKSSKIAADTFRTDELEFTVSLPEVFVAS